MMDSRAPPRRPLFLLGLAVIVILVVGSFVTLYAARQQDAAMRQDLLAQTRMGYIAINALNISALTGMNADLTSPTYLALKKQLASITAADPDARFAYLIGRNPDGTYFFYADSEDPTSPDYSPPGQTYPEITGPMISVFSYGNQQTEGPVSDRWGTWVSGYVPFVDPATGRTVAIFGIDVDARDWNTQVIHAALLPGIATLIVLFMLLGFFMVQRRMERARNRIENSERALSESDRNFRTFFETIDDIILVATPDGHILFANTAVERVLGYTAEELAGMHVLDLHPADLRKEAEAIFSAIIRGERTTCPLPLTKKNGKLVPVETRVWFGEWYGKDCIFSIVKNLTFEREAEQRFERLFRNNPALMALSLVSDSDPTFVDVNNAFLARLGFSREEVIGKTVTDLHLFTESAQQKAIADQLKETGRISNIELQVQCKDGTILDGFFSGEIIHSHGREYFLTVMIDITKRKELEREKEYHQRELMRYSDELTRDIAERKRVEQALTEANRKLNMLSGITRHDIKNQLMALHAYIELSQKNLDKPKELTGYIAKQRIVADTINRQISFTRDYENMGVTSPSWQNVSDLIRDAMTSLPMRDIHVDVERSDLEVYADPLFGKVFYNLIDNALRYGGEGMKTIRVSSQESGSGLTLLCEDDGAGISEENKKRLFTKGFGKHTGLGLFLSQEILAITGITIIENGVPGKGARFEIQVPTGLWRYASEAGGSQ